MFRRSDKVFLLACFCVILAAVVVADRSDPNVFRVLSCFEIKVTAADEKERPAVNTVNGSGLDEDLCDNRWDGTWLTCPGENDGENPNYHSGTAEGAAWIKYEFNRVYCLHQMKVWNYNEDVNRGFKEVVIEYSADGETWKKLGEYTFAKGTGKTNYAANTRVDFKGLAVRAVVITARKGQGVGNYGDPDGRYGLSEVRFYVDGDESIDPTRFIAPPAKLRLKLERGITLDRQIRSDPPAPYVTISCDDIKLIKSMKFEFVKLLINPAVFKSEAGLKSSNMWYFDQIINFVVDENLPVVICIHPEHDFKKEYLGNESRFESLLKFYDALAGYMAQRWTPDQLALQLMTEPAESSPDPDDWNYWDTLQHRIWRTVRGRMPEHTLILGGDMTGTIEGVYDIKPVNDENVMYSFTFYEPTLFTFQGGPRTLGLASYLNKLPYPSDSGMVREIPNLIGDTPDDLKVQLRGEVKRYAEECWSRRRLDVRIGKLREWNRYYGNGLLKIWCAEFGCYQGGVNPADRVRYIEDIRSVFGENKIGWAYWSYNETFSVMTDNRTPLGPASEQTPDQTILKALMPDKFR